MLCLLVLLNVEAVAYMMLLHRLKLIKELDECALTSLTEVVLFATAVATALNARPPTMWCVV